jgi:hypothetical protein
MKQLSLSANRTKEAGHITQSYAGSKGELEVSGNAKTNGIPVWGIGGSNFGCEIR